MKLRNWLIGIGLLLLLADFAIAAAPNATTVPTISQPTSAPVPIPQGTGPAILGSVIQAPSISFGGFLTAGGQVALAAVVVIVVLAIAYSLENSGSGE